MVLGNFLRVIARSLQSKSHGAANVDKAALHIGAVAFKGTVVVVPIQLYEVFPLLCPKRGGQMRLIAFITEGTQIRKILDHSGVDSEPPHISPARAPPLWDDCSDAHRDDGAQIEPADWDLAAQAAPDFEVDQRISW